MLTNGSEVTLQGKRVRLRPCEETDMDTMYKWRNDMSTLHLWSIRRHTVNFDEFAAELKADFAIDRHIQLLMGIAGSQFISNRTGKENGKWG